MGGPWKLAKISGEMCSQFQTMVYSVGAKDPLVCYLLDSLKAHAYRIKYSAT